MLFGLSLVGPVFQAADTVVKGGQSGTSTSVHDHAVDPGGEPGGVAGVDAARG